MAIRHLEVEERPVLPRMSEEEFERWEATFEGRAEFVDGEVIVLMPESLTAEDLVGFLYRLIHLYAVERGLGKAAMLMFEARLRPGLRRVPDLVYIVSEAYAHLHETYIAGGPSIAVEIVSKGSQGRDRRDKLRDYEAAGVQEYWLIDPKVREAIFYRLGSSGKYRKVRIVRGRFHSAVIPGFWLEVDWLWQDPLPKTLPILQQLMENVADQR